MRLHVRFAVLVTVLLLVLPGLIRVGTARLSGAPLGEVAGEALSAGVGFAGEGVAAIATRLDPGLALRFGLPGLLLAGGVFLVILGLRDRSGRLPRSVRPGTSLASLARRTGLSQDVLRALIDSEGTAFPRRSR